VCLVIVALIVLGAMAKRSQYHSPKEASPYLAKAVKMNETRTQKVSTVSIVDALPIAFIAWADPSVTTAADSVPEQPNFFPLLSPPLRS
jgi:hypothetical protein